MINKKIIGNLNWIRSGSLISNKDSTPNILGINNKLGINKK